MWRARLDRVNNRLIFEYTNTWDSDNWTENVNARIDTSGFSGIDADFTVRGAEDGVVATIHYSDGVDTYIAESNEASVTGWAWENITKVFDGVTDSGTYQRVNLAADRNTSGYKLWATAVFDDTSNIWVKTRKQTTSGDITGWQAAEDVSDNTNTDPIYGQVVRSIGETGALKTDMIFL